MGSINVTPEPAPGINPAALAEAFEAGRRYRR